MLTPAALEKAAEALAVACNGGEWATHYTEAQKDVWRKRVASVVGHVGK